MVHSVRQSKILTARDPITIPPATPIAQAIPAPVPAFIRRPSYWARRTHATLLRFMSAPPDRASGPYAGVVSPTEHQVVEAIVEVNVYVRRPVTQYGSERRAVGREALVTVVDVFAVRDGSIDSRL